VIHDCETINSTASRANVRITLLIDDMKLLLTLFVTVTVTALLAQPAAFGQERGAQMRPPSAVAKSAKKTPDRHFTTGRKKAGALKKKSDLQMGPRKAKRSKPLAPRKR
jgi:hypothetical protein